MPPEIGDVVHYVSYGTPAGEYGSQCRAAVVTQLTEPYPDTDVGLAVLNPTGLFFQEFIKRGEGPGHWHYTTQCDWAGAK